MNTPDQPTAPGYSGLSKQEVAERLKQPAATRTLADCSPQEIEKLSAQFAGIEPTATATPRTAAERHKTHACYDAVSADFARTLERELSSAQAALAEAEAEVARLIHDKGATNGRIQSQHFELTALRAEVAELRKDKARLTKLFLLAADLAERFFDPGPIPAGSPTEDDIQMGDISYEAQKLRNAARKEGA